MAVGLLDWALCMAKEEAASAVPPSGPAEVDLAEEVQRRLRPPAGAPAGLLYCELAGTALGPAMGRAEAALRALDYQTPQGLSRRVAQFGPVYDYRARKTRAAERALPPELGELQALAAAALAPAVPENCIVNVYEPGQGISAHTDAPVFGPRIACFVFGSAAPVIFRARAPAAAPAHYELTPAAQSLYVMTGPARRDYTHEITARKSDPAEGGRRPRRVRYSATFRSMSEA